MSTTMNNETIGITCEVALCQAYGLDIPKSYEKRYDKQTLEKLNQLDSIPTNELAPLLLAVGPGGGAVDFITETGETVSVKSNQKRIGKIAPQKIGQMTSNTFYHLFLSEDSAYYLPYTTFKPLGRSNEPGKPYTEFSYADQAEIFKTLVTTHPVYFLTCYYQSLFNTDYILIYSDFDKDQPVRHLLKEDGVSFSDYEISFTRDLKDWNESTTIKADGISIGEFQVHNNRDNFKFRFHMNGLIKLGIVKTEEV